MRLGATEEKEKSLSMNGEKFYKNNKNPWNENSGKVVVKGYSGWLLGVLRYACSEKS